MKYLSKNAIIYINKQTIDEHGGNFVPPYNLLKEEPLDYVVEMVQAEMFGQPIYPDLWDKAAVYLFNIVCNHVFSDGNKRTGLAAAIAFLGRNGYRFKPDLVNNEVYDFVMKVASGESNLDECREWFKENITPLES